MCIYIQHSKMGINNSQPIRLVRQRPVEQTGSTHPVQGPFAWSVDTEDKAFRLSPSLFPQPGHSWWRLHPALPVGIWEVDQGSVGF